MHNAVEALKQTIMVSFTSTLQYPFLCILEKGISRWTSSDIMRPQTWPWHMDKNAAAAAYIDACLRSRSSATGGSTKKQNWSWLASQRHFSDKCLKMRTDGSSGARQRQYRYKLSIRVEHSP